jgi:glycosyltransferase involved in cell wall biosynthesis
MFILSNRPALLYVCPVIPLTTGNGMVMRAGMVLEALSGHYRVSLLAVPRGDLPGHDLPEVLRASCEHVAMIPPHSDPQHRIQQARDIYREHTFDVIHVFRLAALPFAQPYFQKGSRRPRTHLDLDDIESKTHRRIAALHRSAGDAIKAAEEEDLANRSRLLETYTFRTFDRIYVCSEPDRQELLERCPAEVRVLKNAVRPPAAVSPSPPSQDFKFLFVGSLGYDPNKDAARYFCREILPIIRERAPTPFRVDFVGGGACHDLLDLGAPDVRIVGPVEDVQPWYEACHAVIVPLRAAGGTRIKILEAFSYQRPVVTTSIGVEGIEAQASRDVLVADQPESFASACLRLMSEPDLAKYLAGNASSMLAQRYSSEELKISVSA